jgi:hypothetical protein
MFKQGKRISGSAGKTSDDFIVVQAAHFASIAFHHRVAQSNLAVTANHDFIASAHR